MSLSYFCCDHLHSNSTCISCSFYSYIYLVVHKYPTQAGTYRAEYGGTASSDCATCTAGSYCPKASYTPLLCPRGYYCPAGTSEPEACTPGTYGNVAGLKQVEECIDCDPGYYCETYALQAPTGLCTAGYFCAGGTNTSTPQRGYGAGNWTSGICPQGYYCDQGSATPAACPAGYFNENEGGTSSAACTDCTPGQYCEGLANIYPTGRTSAPSPSVTNKWLMTVLTSLFPPSSSHLPYRLLFCGLLLHWYRQHAHPVCYSGRLFYKYWSNCCLSLSIGYLSRPRRSICLCELPSRVLLCL